MRKYKVMCQTIYSDGEMNEEKFAGGLTHKQAAKKVYQWIADREYQAQNAKTGKRIKFKYFPYVAVDESLEKSVLPCQ
jgi:hypothetical protein